MKISTTPLSKLHIPSVNRRIFLRNLVGLASIGFGSVFVACGNLILSSHIPSGTKLLFYKGHKKFVFTVGWSSDGLNVASGGNDQMIQVWAALSGEQIATYAHSGIVTSLAWSPSSEGELIASGCEDKHVYVWDTETGTHTTIDRGQAGIWGLGWSPEGNRIASSGGSTVQIHEVATRQLLLQYSGHHEHVWCLSWSPDGQYIASGGDDRTVHIWSVQDGLQKRVFARHNDSVRGVDWSPNGQYIASGGIDNTLIVWEATSGHVVFLGQHDDDIYGVSWSPDGRYIATSSRDATVKVWDVNQREIVALYDGQSGSIYKTVWSPDRIRLASACRDSVVQVWELPQSIE